MLWTEGTTVLLLGLSDTVLGGECVPRRVIGGIVERWTCQCLVTSRGAGSVGCGCRVLGC